jgi:prepilin-type N-terminal cleavage/methylation domain-containing protein
MKKNGFTLIEILVVLAVIGIIFACALPPVANFSASLALKASAKTLVAEIRKTQGRAMARHQTLSLDPTKISFPSGIFLAQASNICFSPSGFTPPGGSGTLILQNRLGHQKKVIVSSVGRVRLE